MCGCNIDNTIDSDVLINPLDGPTDFTYYVVTENSEIWYDPDEHANTTYVEPEPEVSVCVEGITDTLR